MAKRAGRRGLKTIPLQGVGLKGELSMAELRKAGLRNAVLQKAVALASQAPPKAPEPEPFTDGKKE